jgi:hypothetical protein
MPYLSFVASICHRSRLSQLYTSLPASTLYWLCAIGEVPVYMSVSSSVQWK